MSIPTLQHLSLVAALESSPYMMSLIDVKKDVMEMKDDIAKLQFIGRARRFGFSIQECRELLSLYQDKNRPSREVKELTLEKLSKIDNKLDELKNLRKQLYRLSKSCSGDDRPDCPILDALASEN